MYQWKWEFLLNLIKFLCYWLCFNGVKQRVSKKIFLKNPWSAKLQSPLQMLFFQINLLSNLNILRLVLGDWSCSGNIKQDFLMISSICCFTKKTVNKWAYISETPPNQPDYPWFSKCTLNLGLEKHMLINSADMSHFKQTNQNLLAIVNLGIGISALELELELEMILQTPLFPVSYGLWTPNFAEWWLRMRAKWSTKPRDTSISWSPDKSKTLYLHFHKAYGPQT